MTMTNPPAGDKNVRVTQTHTQPKETRREREGGNCNDVSTVKATSERGHLTCQPRSPDDRSRDTGRQNGGHPLGPEGCVTELVRHGIPKCNYCYPVIRTLQATGIPSNNSSEMSYSQQTPTPMRSFQKRTKGPLKTFNSIKVEQKNF